MGKDVNINVSKLDLDQSSDAIEKKEDIVDRILQEMGDQEVMLIVLHTPTRFESHILLKFKDAGEYIRAAVKAFNGALHGGLTPTDEFVAICHFTKTNEVRFISVSNVLL